MKSVANKGRMKSGTYEDRKKDITKPKHIHI